MEKDPSKEEQLKEEQDKNKQIIEQMKNNNEIKIKEYAEELKRTSNV